MKKSILSLIIGLLFTVTIPVTLLFVPGLKGILKVPFDMFSFALGAGVLLATLLFTENAKSEEKLDKITKANSMKQLINMLNNKTAIYAVTKEASYEKMNDFVKNSKKQIDLMYLGILPPSDNNRYKLKYIESLKKVIVADHVPVRRIIFLSNDTKEWIKGLTKDYEGHPDVSLSILDGEPFDMMISVQLFDDSSVVLMNFDASHRTADKRDIIVETEDNVFFNIFKLYYEKLFSKAIPIIESGKKNQTNYDNKLKT